MVTKNTIFHHFPKTNFHKFKILVVPNTQVNVYLFFCLFVLVGWFFKFSCFFHALNLKTHYPFKSQNLRAGNLDFVFIKKQHRMIFKVYMSF